MRDAFISHASENKEDIAIPLVAALESRDVTCWLDKYELQVGDSLRQQIDRGLAESRFGVVLLSRAYFAAGKYWTGAELDGLVQREVGGQKVILPVWVDVGHGEIVQRSPLLAGRIAAQWADGVERVADDLTRAIRGTSVAPEPGSRGPTSNLMLTVDDREVAFLRAVEFEHADEKIRVTLRPRSAHERAFLSDLRGSRATARLSYNDASYEGRLVLVRQRSSATGETVELELESADQRSSPMDMSYNGISADRIAELRARYILLGSADDQPELMADSSTMLRSFVEGGMSGERAVAVPVRQLRKDADSDGEFLARVCLFAVDQLVTSHVVERILRLDFSLAGGGVRIEFEGRRHRRYANEAPALVHVSGSRDY